MDSKLSDNNYKVYKHTCPNGKVYIGITKCNPLERWGNGFGYESQTYFFRAIVKYGWINIKHEILYDNLSEQEAKKLEIQLIKEYNSQDINYGYNIDLGCIHVVSKKCREAISNSKKGKKWSERQRLGHLEYIERHKGRTVYKYTRDGELITSFRNVSLAARDAGIPTETLRTYLHNNRVPEKFNCIYSYYEFSNPVYIGYKDRKWNKLAVDMFDMSLNYVRTFDSIADAERMLGSSGRHISDVCKGKRLSCKGYIWRYHDENTDNKNTK